MQGFCSLSPVLVNLLPFPTFVCGKALTGSALVGAFLCLEDAPQNKKAKKFTRSIPYRIRATGKSRKKIVTF